MKLDLGNWTELRLFLQHERMISLQIIILCIISNVIN